MRARFVFAFLILLTVAARFMFAQSPASISDAGWRITADSVAGALTIEHGQLGVILNSARLAVRDGSATRVAQRWSAHTGGNNELLINTGSPNTSWRFRITGNDLEISTTSFQGVITASAPASASRVAARLVDREGPPVEWAGTPEVKHTYGGSMTVNASFLPRKNADYMYFGLGQVSGSQFHALFDRPTDTAIEFAEGTVMERNQDVPDQLRITMPIPGYSMIRLIPDYYTTVLGLPFYDPFDDRVFKSAPMVWSSWTSYYSDVTEKDIVRNTDWLAANLRPYGFQYVQLDDGYDRDDRGQHYWIENWDRKTFPHGPQWLTNYIKSKGLRAGLWLVPNAYAGALQAHPDWYLRDKDGKLILDYRTPALDSTNPVVLDFVKHLFTTLDDWGFDYYKFDGEHAIAKYAPAVDRSKLYDPNADLMANYRQRLSMIRSTLGPGRFIEGCPAGTPLNGTGYFNSYFNGEDLYSNWQGMYPLFSSITANGFLNHIVTYVMPGEGLELGKPITVAEAMTKRPKIVIDIERDREDPMTGFGVTDAEARTLVSYIALTGVVYPLASVMPELPPDRVELLKKTMPTLPILPMDLFSRGTDVNWATFKHVRADNYIHNYPELLDLKVNSTSGIYDVAAVTNWRAEALNRDIVFGSELGLDPDGSYIVFDFWKDQLLGIFKNRARVDVAPHDTRVLFIRPKSKVPQFLGTSRHITGAFSVLNVSWDDKKHVLSGSSQGVPSETYKLWIYVPQPADLMRVQAASKAGEIPVNQKVSENLLTVSFEGQAGPVDWAVAFRQ
ncbi:MAG TPA: alpha-galactosidase [Bryobacteraceae bacterium]|nr:alpha-galactosidase [Bryobacteraceae bacterium]